LTVIAGDQISMECLLQVGKTLTRPLQMIRSEPNFRKVTSAAAGRFVYEQASVREL